MASLDDLGIVEATVPALDGCPILTRLKCFVTQVGVTPTLRHVVRDRTGVPIDLSSLVDENSESTTTSSITLRSGEIVTQQLCAEVDGDVTDAENGVVDFALTAEQVAKPGVYQLSIGIQNQFGTRVYVDNPLLLVEKSLFVDPSLVNQTWGPPTIQEVRQALMDSSGVENLLLDAMEYSDDQIAFAYARPVRQWNETPPPLRPGLDTRNFPFSEAWLNAICGHLLVMAANNYRRNKLPYSAGGISIDDKSKEPEYLKAGLMLLEEYKQFVQYKKYEINTALVVGSVGSTYGGLFR